MKRVRRLARTYSIRYGWKAAQLDCDNLITRTTGDVDNFGLDADLHSGFALVDHS